MFALVVRMGPDRDQASDVIVLELDRGGDADPRMPEMKPAEVGRQ